MPHYMERLKHEACNDPILEFSEQEIERERDLVLVGFILTGISENIQAVPNHNPYHIWIYVVILYTTL